MPFIRILSHELSVEKKRHIAASLTPVVHRAMHLPVTPSDWCVIRFESYRPEDLAVTGILVADSKDPDYFVEVTGRDLGEEEKKALTEGITSTLAGLLELSGEKLFKINIFIKGLAAEDTAVGGKFSTGTGPKR
jgi:phenylpyruvate tautomerase PptA (4-oxalocrotonate tautomerase family)